MFGDKITESSCISLCSANIHYIFIRPYHVPKKKDLKWFIKLKFNVTQYSFNKIKIKTSVNDTGGGWSDHDCIVKLVQELD